jgi:hypothetical protein
MISPAGRRFVAIGFQWKLAPTIVEDFHALLCVVRVDGILTKASPKILWRYWHEESQQHHLSYRVAFPPPGKAEGDTFDVSGVLGLMGPGHAAVEDKATEALERAVADAIVWELSSCSLNSSAPEQVVVLIDGPLLPKLRGRLYYRLLDHRLPLFFVTYRHEWLKHLLRGRRPENTSRTSEIGPGIAWFGPSPPLAVDAPSRVFLSSASGEVLHHVEIPANTLPVTLAKDHWSQMRELCESVFQAQWLPAAEATGNSEPRWATLPAPLAAASSLAAERLRDDFQEELVFANWRVLRRRSETHSRVDVDDAAADDRVSKKRRVPKEIEAAQEMDSVVLGVSVDAATPAGRPEPENLREAFFGALAVPEKAARMKELFKPLSATDLV